jgi:uncharacterized membrane protein YphA (DoxX/SURF4 family)
VRTASLSSTMAPNDPSTSPSATDPGAAISSSPAAIGAVQGQRPRRQPTRPPRPIPLRPLGTPSYPLPSRGWALIGTAAGCVLGGVLLVAAWAKALDPAAFAQQIHADGLDRLLPASAVALLALALEAGLGVALALGVRRLWVLAPAALLVTSFLGLTGRAWWLDAHGKADPAAASCGCFGNLVQRTPAEAFWQDLTMLALPAALAFAGRNRNGPRVPPVRATLAVAFAVAAPVFAWRAPDLPLDDLATRLKPGVRIGDLCTGGGRGGNGGATGGGSGGAGGESGAVCLDSVAPELARGNHLVVLDDLDDPLLAKAVGSLNAYADAPGAAAVWVLTASDARRQRLFFWKWGPAFKIVEAPAPLLRPLYRRLPRSFAVQDGKVTATFSGLPPLPAAQRPPAPAGTTGAMTGAAGTAGATGAANAAGTARVGGASSGKLARAHG